MKTNLLKMFLLVLILVMVGFAPAANSAVKLRIAGNFPVDHSSSQAMEMFKKRVAELTNAEVVVDTFPAMQLGGAGENLDQVRSGALFGTWLGIAFLSRTVPELEAVSLPFLFSNREQAFRVIDGEVGKLFDQKLTQKGFISLGYMELGTRHTTNSKRPLKTVNDFKGLKIRLQPNETHIATFRAIGTNPVTMDIKEVYQALQQGVLDGQENPYSVILSRNFNETQKFLSDSGHFFDFIIIAVNKQQYESLKPSYKNALNTAIAEAVKWQRQKAAQEDEVSRVELIKRGMQFDAISPAVRAELQRLTADVANRLKSRIGADVVDAVYQGTK